MRSGRPRNRAGREASEDAKRAVRRAQYSIFLAWRSPVDFAGERT